MMSEEAENSGVPEASTAASKPLFRDLDADVDLDELETSEIESLCMRCYKEVIKLAALGQQTMMLQYDCIILRVHNNTCSHPWHVCVYSEVALSPGSRGRGGEN